MAVTNIQPVIGWGAVDATRPIIKKIVSAMGWGASLISNCVLTTGLMITWHGNKSPGSPIPFWIIGVGIALGIVLFLVLTGGQIYTIGESRWGYRCFLIPDSLITAWQAARLMHEFISVLSQSPELARIATGIIAAIIGLASAKLPELFMFGPKTQMGDHRYDEI